tara:strand:+ start:106 stop:381 length:276 start_codon:yes stop_codon:yes gene_type:complete
VARENEMGVMKKQLRLYVRQHCTLCEQMYRELLECSERLGIEVQGVDIDDDPLLRAQFDHKVPVLADGNEEICHHFLDHDMLIKHLGHDDG